MRAMCHKVIRVIDDVMWPMEPSHACHAAHVPVELIETFTVTSMSAFIDSVALMIYVNWWTLHE